jgi:FPC/CPF motif-containing protein YcgG
MDAPTDHLRPSASPRRAPAIDAAIAANDDAPIRATCPHAASRGRLLKVRGRGTVTDARRDAPVDEAEAAPARLLPDFVFGTDHPCVMARSALQRANVRVAAHARFGTASAAASCEDLYACLADTRAATGAFVSYAALFVDEAVEDELAFEHALWRQLQTMHDADRARFDWCPEVSSDPADPAFSFSIGGHAWYVIGMHPQASRPARRLAVPALVFNPHAQFERLRATGRYVPLRDRIRARDVARHGSINPMLADHGQSSEARQYSGRVVEADWRCPFVARPRGPAH